MTILDSIKTKFSWTCLKTNVFRTLLRATIRAYGRSTLHLVSPVIVLYITCSEICQVLLVFSATKVLLWGRLYHLNTVKLSPAQSQLIICYSFNSENFLLCHTFPKVFRNIYKTKINKIMKEKNEKGEIWILLQYTTTYIAKPNSSRLNSGHIGFRKLKYDLQVCPEMSSFVKVIKWQWSLVCFYRTVTTQCLF